MQISAAHFRKFFEFVLFNRKCQHYQSRKIWQPNHVFGHR